MNRPVSGGTLFVIIASVLFLVIAGILVVTAGKIMYSSQQVSGAADAAALAVARQLATAPTVNAIDIGTPAFAGLGENGSNEISLLTYNKAVGKTILVAIAAEEDKSASSLAAAKEMKQQLDKLAGELERKISKSSELARAFDVIASANIIKIGGKHIERSGDLDWSCVGKGESSDVYFDPGSMSSESYKKLSEHLNRQGPTSASGQHYLKGYEPVTFAGITVEAIPVFPGQQPHLISLNDFDSGKQVHHLLPNALKVNSTYKRQGLLQTAAAVIGKIQNTTIVKKTAPTDLPVVHRPIPSPAADDPNACIVFMNVDGAQINTDNEIVSDGENDLFNKELFSPSRIVQSTNGVFTTDTAQMDAWVAFNNNQGPDPRGSFDTKLMRSGSSRDNIAQETELLAIKAIDCECTHTMYTPDLAGPCKDSENIRKWAQNYRRWSLSAPAAGTQLTAYEAAKYDVLSSRAKFSQTATGHVYRGTSYASGMRLLEENKEYSCPPYPVNFSADGTPYELIQQMQKRTCKQSKNKGSRASNNDAIDRLYQDIRKIKPFATDQEIASALNSKKLRLGQKLWLKKEGNALVLSTSGPPFRSMLGACYPHTCNATINLAGTVVNCSGDAHFADAPYSWNTEVEVIANGERDPATGLFYMKKVTVDARNYDSGYFGGIIGLETISYEPCWFQEIQGNEVLGGVSFSCQVNSNPLSCPN